jgi:hypothetical protein
MPRRKPPGWPVYMVAKRLRGGITGYYWAPPTWALKKGCQMNGEALGSDYAERSAAVMNFSILSSMHG